MVDGQDQQGTARAPPPLGGDQRQGQGVSAPGKRNRYRARAAVLQAAVEALADRVFEAGGHGRAGGCYPHFAWTRTVAARDLMASGALG